MLVSTRPERQTPHGRRQRQTKQQAGLAAGRRAPVRQARWRQARLRESRALLAPRSHSRKSPTMQLAASGRSATSSRPAAASPAASAPADRSRLPAVAARAASDRRATSSRPTASPREAGSSRVAQSPSSKRGSRWRRAAVRPSRSARAPTATGRSSKRPDQRSGRTTGDAAPAVRHDRPERTARPPRRETRPSSAGSVGRSRPFTSRPPSEEEGAGSSERIAKRLARAGIASRRDAEALIADGRVKVNGVKLTSPAFNVSAVRHDRARRRRDPADRAHAAVPVPQARPAWSPPTAIRKGAAPCSTCCRRTCRG